ncbi:MAG: hypothetical protein JKY10_05425 [Cohaesibacteraceae bacterium]|nr:hypothetical protein [Cohaesibacteraceae bacterium]
MHINWRIVVILVALAMLYLTSGIRLAPLDELRADAPVTLNDTIMPNLVPLKRLA